MYLLFITNCESLYSHFCQQLEIEKTWPILQQQTRPNPWNSKSLSTPVKILACDFPHSVFGNKSENQIKIKACRVFCDIQGHSQNCTRELFLILPLNNQSQPFITALKGAEWCAGKLTNSPGISLQSLRWVAFPTQGVLLWAPQTRLLVWKPESSQVDHRDQAIQPPEQKKNRQIKINSSNRHHVKMRRTWKQSCPPKLLPSAPVTSLASQAAQTHQEAFVMSTRLQKQTQKVCLVHSWDICLLSQALGLFPRSRLPGNQQKLLPQRKKGNPTLSSFFWTRHSLHSFGPHSRPMEWRECTVLHWKSKEKSQFVTWRDPKCAAFGREELGEGRGRTHVTFHICPKITKQLFCLQHLLPFFCVNV